MAQDPTFGNELLLSKAAIDHEQSGYYLVPAGRLPVGWQPVSEVEGANIWGKGNAGANSEPGPPGVAPEVKCPRTNPGMANYNVDAARVSLTITDTPVGYVPPVGPPSNSWPLTSSARSHLCRRRPILTLGTNGASLGSVTLSSTQHMRPPSDCLWPGRRHAPLHRLQFRDAKLCVTTRNTGHFGKTRNRSI